MNTNPHIPHYEALQALTPSMRYTGGSLDEWQKEAREKLAELLGINKIKTPSDDMFKIEYENDCGDFIDRRITFQSEEGYFAICHLWTPKGIQGKIPMVICLQGHSKGAHISLGRPKYENDEITISGGDRNFAVQIVREGYAALAIEQRGFGECGGTPDGPACQVPTMAALLYGRTMIGNRVFDVSRAIDVITKNFDFIDSDKIACMGNSGGGTATTYAAAIEKRIKVAMPSCAVCSFKDSIGAMKHCTCNFIPGIANYFDMSELCGLIAPRGLVIVSGAEDRSFPHKGVAETVEITKAYYEAAGVPEKFHWIEGPNGHRFYADLSWPAFHKLFD